ncbi:hypothetical protein D3C86_1514800 [compost metagenome]
MPGEMRLIGKTAGEGRFGKARTRAHHVLAFLQPPHDEITVRARAEQATKVPEKREAVEPAYPFQFFRTDGVGAILQQIVPASQNRDAVNPLDGSGASV